MDIRRIDGSGAVASAPAENTGSEGVKEAKKGIAEEARSYFEAPPKKNSLDGYVSEQGEARTAKGKALQQMTEAKFGDKGPGEARTAKGKAYQEKLKQEALDDAGEARTAKGKAYQELVKRGDIKPEASPGEARTAKGKAYQQMLQRGE